MKWMRLSQRILEGISPISARVTSSAMGQSYCLSASEEMPRSKTKPTENTTKPCVYTMGCTAPIH